MDERKTSAKRQLPCGRISVRAAVLAAVGDFLAGVGIGAALSSTVFPYSFWLLAAAVAFNLPAAIEAFKMAAAKTHS